MCACVHAQLLQSCLTFCDPKDCSPPGSSVRRILQVKILEWVAISFSRGSSQPRDLPNPGIEPGSPALQADSFFKISFIYFNWRIISWQCCGGFCHTLTWITHGCACVPPSWTPLPLPFPTPSLCAVPEHRLWVPCSWIKLALVIYFTYGNIDVSMLFSQIIPLSPSPTESKSLFFTSVSLLLPYK